MRSLHTCILSCVCVLSAWASMAQAEVQGAFLLRSEGVQVTVFRDSAQPTDKGYVLVEGTGTEWDLKPTEVQVKDLGSGSKDYNIEWHGRPYTFLAGRSGSFSLSLPKPYKVIEGLYQPFREEVKVDLPRVEALLAKSQAK
jgi:hypothetical protein